MSTVLPEVETTEKLQRKPQILGDEVIGEYEKFLIYGPSGSGKTFAAGTMPGNIYFLVIGAKNELKTLRSPDFRSKYPGKYGHIFYDYVKENLGRRGTFVQANAYDWACDRIDEMLLAEQRGDIPHIDSIVIDSATGLRGVAMNKAIEITHDRAKGKEKTALKRLQDQGIILPGDTDYGSEQSLIWKFLNWIIELDKHFCLVTHEWTETKSNRETRVTEVVARKPLFTGQHRENVPLMFDNVWRFHVVQSGKAQSFRAQTIGDDEITARTRFGGLLGPIISDVNFDDVIRKFKDWARQHPEENVVSDGKSNPDAAQTSN